MARSTRSLVAALGASCVLAAGVAALPATANPGSHPSPAQPAVQAAKAKQKTPSATMGARVWTQDIAPLATIGGVQVTGSGYGSSFVARPGSHDSFYGLTDRGPNVDAPNGDKLEPLANFTPAIGEFKLRKGKAELVRTITLKAADGTPYDGRVALEHNTGETIADLNDKPLGASPYGYDPEGLVAMRDGSFWVSDEYGPFITHFGRDGRQLERLTPFDGSLPVELAEREPNKGMEGLTITPDGKTLVGMMQAALNAPDGKKSKNISALRIVTIDLRTRATHQYVYLLHNTDGASTTVSEIAALNNREFLVDERDSKVEPKANKKLFRITLDGATDVSRNGALAKATGNSYDIAKGGLLVGGRSVEAIAGTGSTDATATNLKAAGITPVSSKLFLDYAGLVTAIDPTGGFFGHDKVEGVAVLDGGRRVVLANDSDFGLDGVTNATAPFQLKPKMLPNGTQDVGELLDVEMARVPAQFKG